MRLRSPVESCALSLARNGPARDRARAAGTDVFPSPSAAESSSSGDRFPTTFGDNQQNGNNDVHWLKVIVDPGSREVFRYEPQIVPENRTAVPSLRPALVGCADDPRVAAVEHNLRRMCTTPLPFSSGFRPCGFEQGDGEPACPADPGDEKRRGDDARRAHDSSSFITKTNDECRDRHVLRTTRARCARRLEMGPSALLATGGRTSRPDPVGRRRPRLSRRWVDQGQIRTCKPGDRDHVNGKIEAIPG